MSFYFNTAWALITCISFSFITPVMRWGDSHSEFIFQIFLIFCGGKVVTVGISISICLLLFFWWSCWTLYTKPSRMFREFEDDDSKQCRCIMRLKVRMNRNTSLQQYCRLHVNIKATWTTCTHLMEWKNIWLTAWLCMRVCVYSPAVVVISVHACRVPLLYRVAWTKTP